ncbi:MAG: DNA polymerase III subunit gamma/tau [bacterium]|nr:DNA polymerase III subunit gamma/tau [Gammaproteobacteria bacterium]
MSYQVLARKYRPANFEELEGQEHVLRALVNALDNDRLHHAYLFTGTRGVGKTTIARILAKCLNCETGVSSKPCGQCGSCVEIAQGRSIDLIEYDAASRTKVEDTREILDNVQYMPAKNRFKVYLIDEVHMLSNHSFNALLKTLEEPPEHVKFLLATTDPKKLPITVLSRCLQFNLKNLSPERIVSYLRQILTAEAVTFDDPALWQLGRAADGSMRDALSLTDQAISFGNNSVRDADVKLMLGSIDQRSVYELLDLLIQKNASGLLGKITQLSEFSPDYGALLAEVLSVLHRVAVAQAVPAGIDNSQGDRELIIAIAEAIGREDVQLFYQIGLIGQRDLPFSPDPRTGFEMIMLRMLAFSPAAATGEAGTGESELKKKTASVAPIDSATSRVSGILASLGQDSTEPVIKPVSDPVPDPIPDPSPDISQEEPAKSSSENPEVAPDLSPGNWVTILPMLGLSGVTFSLASNCVIRQATKGACQLRLNEHHASLWNSRHESRIEAALVKLYQRDIKVKVEIGEATDETPAAARTRKQDEARAAAVKEIENDENVRQLINSFDGTLEHDTIAARQQSGD